MTVYGGFDPGTFQPWALNLQQKSLGQPGIGYGMQVTPTSPVGMNVNVNVDAVALDGVCFLPNGAWLRIDATATLSVPANSGGSTRTDAVTAYVDPTGTTALGLYYIQNWNSGFTPSGNTLPLALVSVPNGASSIVAANIVETPLLANAGGGSMLQQDAVIGDTSNTYAQPGVFVSYNLTVSTSALANQTSFAVPLTQLQRLTPMGRIGGMQELGFFAGPKGWYMPKVFGSVSGELPISSVDAVNGNLNTAKGAQAGETVYASFKYYDFSEDAQPQGGVRFLTVDSPYCVYQGEALPGVLQKLGPLFPTRQSIQLQAGESVFVTVHVNSYFGGVMAVNAAGVKFSTWANGAVVVNNIGAEYNAGLSPYPLSLGLYPPNGAQANVYQLQCNAGTLEFGGGAVGNYPGTTNYFQDGGAVTVNGRTILLNNASVGLFAGLSVPTNGLLSGYTYVDQHGNLGNTLGAQVAERFAGRIPVVSALQYGGNLQGGNPAYGFWPLTEAPYQTEPAHLAAGTIYGDGGTNGWHVNANPASPYGVELVCSSGGDMLSLRAYATGLDMVTNAANSTALNVNVQGVTSYQYWVTPTSGYVSLTVATSLPATTNVIQLIMATTDQTFLAVAALDLRFPAATPPQLAATPLAEVYLANAALRRVGTNDLLGISITQPRAGSITWAADAAFGMASRRITLDNVSTDQSINLATVGNSVGRLVFIGGTATGQALVQVGSWTSTIDTFSSTGFGLMTTQWFSASFNQWTSVTVKSLGTKNASSNGTTLYIVGIDTFQHPLHVKDARPWADDGYHPSALGSSLLSFQGQPTPSQFGIGTDHLQDRGVTSRKMRPGWTRAIATNAFSAFPGVDTALTSSIVVDTPSVLDISVVWPARYNGGAGAVFELLVDGNSYTGNAHLNTSSTVNQALAGVTHRDLITVGPGAHTVQWQVNSYGTTAAPYTESTTSLGGWPRILTIVAYAL